MTGIWKTRPGPMPQNLRRSGAKVSSLHLHQGLLPFGSSREKGFVPRSQLQALKSLYGEKQKIGK